MLKSKFFFKFKNPFRKYSIFAESKITIADNTGVKIGKCIHLKPYSKHKGTKPAGIVKISVQKIKKTQKFSKGELCRGILIRSKKMYQRDTGLSFKSNDNSIILIDNKNIPIGSRIYGPIFKELKYYDLYPKAILMARLKI